MPFDIVSHDLETGAGGWNVTAGWSNATGEPLAFYSAKWTVPVEPLYKGAQVIFLFTGIETADSSHILQPVLQWGLCQW